MECKHEISIQKDFYLTYLQFWARRGHKVLRIYLKRSIKV